MFGEYSEARFLEVQLSPPVGVIDVLLLLTVGRFDWLSSAQVGHEVHQYRVAPQSKMHKWGPMAPKPIQQSMG